MNNTPVTPLRQMKKSDFLRVLESKLELDPDSLNGKQVLRETEFWDSLAAIAFVAVVDEAFGCEVTGDQLAGCITVDDLIALLGTAIEA